MNVRLPLFASMLLAAPVFGGQREVLTGNVTIAASTLPYDFLFQYDERRNPEIAFIDALADSAVLKTWPNQRFEVERDVFIISPRSSAWPRDTSRGTVLRLLPSELLAPAGEPLSPERWAGSSTSLHPTLHENQPFEVSGPADFDGDGITDDVDSFPDNPAETTDTDNDGTGNNADPDDDNDFMSDAYEASNGLDPLVNDALQDPDNDGYNNAEESAAGTAAQEGDSSFHIESAEFVAPDQIELKWNALPGRRYEVWRRPQLAPRGQRVQESLRVTGPGSLSVVIPAAAPGDFFFVLVIPDPL